MENVHLIREGLLPHGTKLTGVVIAGALLVNDSADRTVRLLADPERYRRARRHGPRHVARLGPICACRPWRGQFADPEIPLYSLIVVGEITDNAHRPVLSLSWASAHPWG